MSRSQVPTKKNQHHFPKQVQKLNIASNIDLETDQEYWHSNAGPEATGSRPRLPVPKEPHEPGLPCVSQVVVLRMELRMQVQLVLTGNKTRVSLTHILNKEGVCLRIHLDVLKTFQWLPIGNVVMLHGSTGSIFGWVPCDFQAHFSGQQFHVPWLQWVVSYANSATINLWEWQIGKTNFFFQCSLIPLAEEQMTFNLSDPTVSTVTFGHRYHMTAKQTHRTHKLLRVLDNCGWLI